VEPVILLSSLAMGIVAYLAVGLLTGYLPRIGTRVRVPRPARTERHRRSRSLKARYRTHQSHVRGEPSESTAFSVDDL